MAKDRAPLSIKVDGLAELLNAMDDLGYDVAKDLEDAVNATGLELRGDIIKRYQRGPASGRTYEKYSPRRTHQASAPWQSPMTDTGRLANATTYYTPIDKKNRATVVVQNDIVYAAALEYGHTYDRGRRIEERPAWRPAVEKITPKHIKRVNKVMAEAIRRAT